MKHQTTVQIIRCFNLGGYTATVEAGELKVRGPQPLAGPLPASIKARREKIIDFLEGCCGGVWPPAKDSEFYTKSEEERLDRIAQDQFNAHLEDEEMWPEIEETLCRKATGRKSA